MGIYLIGVTLLTGVLEAGFSFNLGNALALLCAVCFATLITYLGSYAKGTDTGILVFFMAVTQAVMGGLLFFAMDFASFSPASINWGISILCVLGLAGVGSFLCTSLQTYAQKYTTPSSAVLLLSLESVFASTFSVLLGFEPFAYGSGDRRAYYHGRYLSFRGPSCYAALCTAALRPPIGDIIFKP